MRTFVASLRALAAVAGFAAVAATFADTASRSAINPFNFFGFFTLQSNILAAAVLAATALAAFAGRSTGGWLAYARGCVTTFMVLVGVVYNTLLVGLPGGVELAWANTLLHVVLPIYLALDWVLFADRPALAWNRLWLVVIYPVVWVTVVLIRGATDGWVPYPFLNPSTGYGSVFAYVVGIAVGFVAFGAAVWAASRWRILRVADVAPGA